MPKPKRIPRVISHYSDSSSESEAGEIDSTSGSSISKSYSTQNTELPDSHVENRSYSSSFQCEDSEFSDDSEEEDSSFFINTTTETDVKSHDYNTQTLSTLTNDKEENNHENLASKDNELNTENISSVVLDNDRVPMLHIVSDNESMDISSEDESDKEDNQATAKHNTEKANGIVVYETNKHEDTIESYIKQLGITNGDELLKYCILKFGRLYCHFNPSLIEKRGCRIHFARKEVDKLVSHLNIFHGVDCNVDIQTVSYVSPNTTEIAFKTTRDDDEASVDSLIDEMLYTIDVPAEEKVQISTETKIKDEKDISDNEFQSIHLKNIQVLRQTRQQEPRKKATVKSNNKLKSRQPKKEKVAITLMKDSKGRTIPFASRVTPKNLRSRTRQGLCFLDSDLPQKDDTKVATRSATTVKEPKKSSTPSKRRKIKPIPKKSVKSTPPSQEERSEVAVEPIVEPIAEPITGTKVVFNSNPTTEASIEPIVNENDLNNVEEKTGEEEVSSDRSTLERSLELIPATNTIPNQPDSIQLEPINGNEIKQSQELTICNECIESQLSSNSVTSLNVTTEKTPNQIETLHLDTESYIENTNSESERTISTSTIAATNTANKKPLRPILPKPSLEASLEEENALVSYDSSSALSNKEQVYQIDMWPLEFGYGFCMKNKYYCNVNRSSSINSCKASFISRVSFLQHLSIIHSLTKKKALELREKEEAEDINIGITDFVLSNAILSNVIEDENFKRLISTVTGASDDIVIPTLDRMNQLVTIEQEKYGNRVKQLLKSQDSISFSIHVWNSEVIPNNEMLIVTAFYTDDAWNWKDIIVGFQPLYKDSTRNSDKASLIEAQFATIIKDLEVEEKVYAIVCPDIYLSISKCLYNEVNFKITSEISKRVIAPCLDQVIEAAQNYLFCNIKNKFFPLKKICKAYNITKSYPKAFASTIAALHDVFSRDYKTIISTKNVISLIEKYNTACSLRNTLKYFILDKNDQLKIKKVAVLIERMRQSVKWLIKSSSQRNFTASKVLFFCMQLTDSVSRVASCYNIKTTKDLIDNSQNDVNTEFPEEDDMIGSLKSIFTLFSKYKSNIEKAHDSPFWRAMVLDTAAFVGYDASNNLKQYNCPAVEAISTKNSKPSTSTRYAIDCQAVEIDRMLNGQNHQQVHSIISISRPTLPSELDTTESLLGHTNSDAQLKRKQGEILTSLNDGNESEPDENCAHKRKRLNESITDSEAYISQFKKDQSKLLCASGVVVEFKGGRKIVHYNLLNNDEVNLGQVRFWGKANKDYCPEIAQLTKQSFSVPTTARECLKTSEGIKKYYTGLTYIHPDASPEEIRQKSLIYVWKKENNIVID